MLIAVVVLAFLLDIICGEPKRYHPLVGFGHLANKAEALFNRTPQQPLAQFLSGALAWCLLVLVPTVLLVLVLQMLVTVLGHIVGDAGWLNEALSALVLYVAVGYRSLREHALAVLRPLVQQQLGVAREQVGRIVSRDTRHLDQEAVRKATIESVLENGSDAIFAPLFWFIVGGVPGVIIYRLSNTLDAMWGYKNERFLVFGRFAAKMDDGLNWLPSRLVALSYALLGKTRQSLYCWRQQAHLLESPNGGVVMAAGAGALGVRLGGDGIYSGVVKSKPDFGRGPGPSNHDIVHSLDLITKTLLLWLCLLAFVQLILLWRPV